MINSGLMSSKTPEWATPQALFDELDKEFNFTLDPCATPENAKCRRYFTKEQNGLLQSWKGERVFCNPPYGREIGKWVKKCDKEAQGGALVVLLIPARTDTTYFHDYIYKKHEVRFLRGRLSFNDLTERGKRAPFPSMVVVMRGKNDKAVLPFEREEKEAAERDAADLANNILKLLDARIVLLNSSAEHYGAYVMEGVEAKIKAGEAETLRDFINILIKKHGISASIRYKK